MRVVKHPRLAGARACQDEERTLGRLDRFPLLGVEALEVSRRPTGSRDGARRNGRLIRPGTGRFALRVR